MIFVPPNLSLKDSYCQRAIFLHKNMTKIVFKTSALLAALIVLLSGCNRSETTETAPKDALFELMPGQKTGVQFVNKVENTEDFNIFSYRNFYNGGGVALGDVNNDGLADVYLTSNMGDNKLYLNRGNFKFEDVTVAAGVAGKKFWSTGVVMVDINADGLLDIYVCNAGYSSDEMPENELYINQGNQNGVPVFAEKAAEYGLNEDGYTTHAAFFDYDNDGDLDCYILNNSFMPVNTLNYSNNREMYAEDWPVRDFLKGGGDKLLRNDGGHFTDVTRKSGIYGSLIGFGLGVTVGDVNGDDRPDLYISNDFFERDYLYINQGNGTFKEEIEKWMQHLSHASMGADMADINNDGFPEIFTTEMLPADETRLKTTTMFENYNIYQLKQQRGFYHQYMQNCLQLNNKDKTFSEIAYYAGVGASDWSWGALLCDLDNDGYRDIYICNGIYKDVIDQDFIDFFADEIVQKMAMTGKKEQINEVLNKMPSNPILNKVFRNTGTSLKFEDKGTQWGFTTPSFSNGAAYSDLDNDGDLDLVVNNVNMEAFVYQNHSDQKLKNHYLSVKLKGKGQNTFAIGAKTAVYRGGEQLNFEFNPSRGFQSSIDYKMVFGLGPDAKIDSVVVIWPDKMKSVRLNPAVDTLLALSWEDAAARYTGNPYHQAASVAHKLVQEVPCTFEPHREDNFVDFYQEGLTYRTLAHEGPRSAAADVNGDGREDVFIGGAKGQAGQLYLQTAAGSFTRHDRATFDRDSTFEDTAVTFFDADCDRDADLFIGAGGNAMLNMRFLESRLYLNDGKGHFTRSEQALPLSSFNTAVAVALDMDADGDQDLFVGNRSVPGQYGVLPRHFLLENDGKGKFRDVARANAPDFAQLGMVTDAALVNVMGDAAPELVVTSEWGSPKILAIQNGKFSLVQSNLAQYSGWWNTLKADDVDGDGDQDLILGNRGDNFYFSGTAEHPAKLWVLDFDQNGTVEKIVTRQVEGRDVPVAMKKELTGQLPALKKSVLRHTEYAKKAIQDLFPADVLGKATMSEGNYFQSAVALNQGNGQFTLVPLPKEVQFSCVCAIWCGDLNADGKNDLLVAGNNDGFMPQFSKLDASFGHTLLNQGNGQYQWVAPLQSGFFVKGDVRSMTNLTVKGKKEVLTTVNGGIPRLFQ
jgi:hypothetical protein